MEITTAEQYVRGAEISPDGTRIAYTADEEDGGALRVLDFDTGAVLDLTRVMGMTDTQDADWSPDGTRLVFTGRTEGAYYYRLYTAAADGTDIVPITGPDVRAVSPAWSPDGTTIAFDDIGSSPGVKLIDPDGSHQRDVASDDHIYSPSWSPDSKKLVVGRFDGSRAQLRVIGTDGSVIADLTSPYKDFYPAWSPDGNYVAFMREVKGDTQVWVRSFGPAIPVPAPSSPATVSIEGGAIYTNSPKVAIHVKPPEGAQSVTVANDGGFLPSSTFAPASRIPWTLQTSGADRLPKTVYVRFGEAGPVYTDDIILDQVDPEITSARVTTTSNNRLAGSPDRWENQRIALGNRTLRVRASDEKSGVMRLQVNRVASVKDARTSRFRSQTTIPAWRTTYVRVRDGATNWSSWKRATRG